MAASESKLTWRRFRGALNESLAADADALAVRSRSVTIACKAQGVSRIFLFSFPALDARAEFSRRVSGLKIAPEADSPFSPRCFD